MIILALSLMLILSAICYSLCRIPSRDYRYIYSKSIIFVDPADIMRFGDLFTVGDAESIYRIMKFLQQRGDIEIIEADDMIYLTSRSPASTHAFPSDLGGHFAAAICPPQICALPNL